MRIRPPEFETSICDANSSRLLLSSSSPPPPPPRAVAVFAGKIVSGQLDEENPFVLISSGLIVQPDEGVSYLVVDRIGVTTAIYREEPDYCNHGWSQAQVPASPSHLGGRHSDPIVTTPMIALDFSGTTQQSASHNVAPNQISPNKHQSTGYAKHNQNDDASTNLNDAVTDYVSIETSSWAPSRNTIISTNLSRLVPDAILKTRRFTYQNNAVSQLCDWFQNSMHNPPLLDSTCATVTATRHFLIDSCNCAPASSSNHHKRNDCIPKFNQLQATVTI
ncbi:xaa-pro aminopeptidase [Dorcoceras hygrometricum]|uniref:Xaa-pro aminopeptidase n=1 Tax=Dorcoceras hygrometricum TaxID=472368 RepID=A0A2Z7AC92_9LAMI|nr:xaa-pro aminopeptidase [Dorcoceras hygrometricum]